MRQAVISGHLHLKLQISFEDNAVRVDIADVLADHEGLQAQRLLEIAGSAILNFNDGLCGDVCEVLSCLLLVKVFLEINRLSFRVSLQLSELSELFIIDCFRILLSAIIIIVLMGIISLNLLQRRNNLLSCNVIDQVVSNSEIEVQLFLVFWRE